MKRTQDKQFVKKYKNKTWLKRMSKEDDLRGALAYLATDLSEYVTGQNLRVDGGCKFKFHKGIFYDKCCFGWSW